MAQTQTNIDVTDPLGSGWMIIAAAMFALMCALVKHTNNGVFNIDSYRQACKIASCKPKI